jgi:dolichol kinase
VTGSPLSKPADLPAIPVALASPAGDRAALTRPVNYARSLFHVASGAFALALLRLAPGRSWLIAVAAAFAVSAWTMEAARRRSGAVNQQVMRLFASVAHPHERHRVNSSTWYVTALLLMAIFAPLRSAEVGVVVLAVADPAAGFIGRRYGRTRLYAGRTLEGTLGFVLAGTIAVVGWLTAFHALPWPPMLVIAVTGAVAGALAELGATRLDDNFTIPVTACAAAAVAGLLLAVG